MKLKNLLKFIYFFFHLFYLNSLIAAIQNDPERNILENLTNQITFTENKGQIFDTELNKSTEILFTCDGKGVKCFFSKTRISYVFSGSGTNLSTKYLEHGTEINDPVYSVYRLDMDLLGSNHSTQAIPLEETNYNKLFYLPQCEQGIVKVKSYKKLLYKEIYPSIDMVVYSTNNKMKYDFIVQPGGNINDIKMKFSGAEKIKKSKDGKLLVFTPLGYIQEDAPFSYQVIGGKTHKIESEFDIDNNTVIFKVGVYDKSKTITIDPTRQWATYLGGLGDDWVYESTSDNNGNIYLTGFTNSTNFPVTTGAHQTAYGGNQDAFLAKINNNGTPIWITYYGGSLADDGRTVTIDIIGGIYLNGFTRSTNFPVSSGAFQSSHSGGTLDAFIIKFNNNGTRQWATYFGGSGSDYGVELATDNKKNIIMAGFTNSTNLPVTSGAYQTSYAGGGNDGFAVMFDSAGTRQWSTYYGGSSDDRFYAVATDSNNNIYLTGSTGSTNFPVSSGAYQNSNSGGTDLAIVKLGSNGTRIWSTYYGGSADEYNYATRVDNSNNIYLTGFTKSSNFPISSGAFQSTFAGGSNDGFLLKINSSGSRIWSTYFGGSGQDDGYRMITDNSGVVYVSGYTLSTNFPVTSDAYQSSYGGGARDAFLIIFNSNGTRQYSTYYGGNDDDYSAGISLDKQYNIYLAGSSYSTNLPVTSGAYQTTKSGGNDLFIVKFSPNKPIITASGPLTFCAGDSVTLSTAIPYSSYKWSHGPTTRNVKITTSGKYAVAVKDANNITTVSDTITVITNPKPKANFYFTNNCQGQQFNFFDSTVISSGTLTYSWDLGDGRTSTLKDVSVIYNTPGTYNVKLSVISNNGCMDSVIKQVTVFANPKADFSFNSQVCEGNALNLANTSIIPANTNVSYLWNFGNGNTSTQTTPVHNYQTSGTYNIKLLIVTQYGCKDSVIKQITVQPKPIANFNFTNVCSGNPAIFSDSSVISNGNLIYKWYFGDGGTSTDQNPVYTFKNPGNYNVSLTVTSTVGCKDSVSKIITVYPQPIKPIISVNGSASFCEGDSATLNAGTGYASYLWSTGDTSQSIIVRQSGNYTVKVTNVNGCMDSALAIKITAHPSNFNLSFTESQRILSTSPFSVVFTNTTPDAGKYNFTWKFGDGKTSTQESPIYSYQDSGLFTITLIAKNKSTGCIDSIVKKDWIYIVKTSGIYNFENILPEIKIYPNPTDASFYIEFDNYSLDKEIKLLLFDGLGRKVSEKHLKTCDSQKTTTIDISNAPKGIYFLRVSSENSSATYKVIKQ